MRRSHAAAAVFALLCAVAVRAHLEFGSYKTLQIGLEVVSLLIVGEWGGAATAPYTTAGQVAAAGAMATVATATLSTLVLSTGGNFYGDGIQGAAHAAQAAQHAAGARVRACSRIAAGLCCRLARAGRTARARCPAAGALWRAAGGRAASGRCVAGAEAAPAAVRPPLWIAGSADSEIAQTRLLNTWNNTYNAPYPALASLPWYTIAGAVDWAGNVTGARGCSDTPLGPNSQAHSLYQPRRARLRPRLPAIAPLQRH
jgi:hypothetical protein